MIHPSTFRKMWAVPSKVFFLNLRNLRTSWHQLHSFREVFSQRSECSYDHRDDLGFHIPHPVNFDLQILVLANFFSFFKNDVLSSGTETSISKQVLDCRSWMTTSVLLAKIFLSVIIESHKMVFSFIFTTLRVCVRTICWELHDQAHGILPNGHGWPPCYVGANIQLMPA